MEFSISFCFYFDGFHQGHCQPVHLPAGVQQLRPGAAELRPHQQGQILGKILLKIFQKRFFQGRGSGDQQGNQGHQQEQQVLQGYGESPREAIKKNELKFSFQ